MFNHTHFVLTVFLVIILAVSIAKFSTDLLHGTDVKIVELIRAGFLESFSRVTARAITV